MSRQSTKRSRATASAAPIPFRAPPSPERHPAHYTFPVRGPFEKELWMSYPASSPGERRLLAVLKSLGETDPPPDLSVTARTPSGTERSFPVACRLVVEEPNDGSAAVGILVAFAGERPNSTEALLQDLRDLASARLAALTTRAQDLLDRIAPPPEEPAP